MKKAMSILMAIFMVTVMLAGCGSGGSSAPAGESQKSEASQAGSSAEQQPAEDGEFENKELSIAVFEGGYGPDYWNEIIKMFEEKYPGVTVDMKISPTIGDEIRPQIVAGNVPDFIYMNDNDQTGVIASMIKENALMDLTDVFDAPGIDTAGPLRDEVQDGILDTQKCAPYGDGRIFLAPFNSSPMALVYNKALFAEHNWETPVTWEDFFKLGEEAKKEGISLFTYQGIYPSYNEMMLFPGMASAEGIDQFKEFLSYKEGTFNNPEVLKVLTNFQEISTKGDLLPGTVALNHTQSQTEWLQNKALFITCGNWIESEMQDAPRADGFEFGMTPVPVLKADDTRYVLTAIEQFSIPAEAKNPELAKEFLRFLYTDESVKLFAEKANGIYALKKATDLVKDLVTPGVYNMNGVYDEAVSMVAGFEALPPGSKIVFSDELFNPITDVMNGGMTPEKWAENVEEAMAEIRADREAAGEEA